MIRIPILALLVASLLALGVGIARADESVVTVGHNRLEPSAITVKAGTVVRFHNEDQMPGGHTIVADDGSFQSPPLAKDQDWSHKFDKPGTYSYSIKQHPAAKGKVVVQ